MSTTGIVGRPSLALLSRTISSCRLSEKSSKTSIGNSEMSVVGREVVDGDRLSMKFAMFLYDDNIEIR